MKEPRRFEVSHEGRVLIGDVVGEDLPTRILMLHGAGQSHRGKMAPLRRELAELGIGSYAFDFVGHGETGGDLASSSLEDRTGQARAVIEHLGLGSPLRILAASMSAHTAVQLTRFHEVAALALIVPAMYARDAYRVKFDGEFSRIIRRPDSWRDSDGWEVLGRFEGRLLVVAAGDDRVIPPQIVQLYHESATSASSRILHVVPDLGHMLFTEMRERGGDRMKTVLRLLVDTFCLV